MSDWIADIMEWVVDAILVVAIGTRHSLVCWRFLRLFLTADLICSLNRTLSRRLKSLTDPRDFLFPFVSGAIP